MPEFDANNNEVVFKVVYYGPGLSGKTTNLEVIHAKTPEKYRSNLLCTATTLYFEFFPRTLNSFI